MSNKRVFGILLVIIGVVFLLNALNVITFDFFSFAGWWTIFLIAPALISMSKQGVTTGNVILLVIGVALFLRERDIDFKGYLLPGVLIVLGISLFVKK
ncbi:MAG: DUF5668 domain-containing protein [Candidatus Izemoplasmatales bacterium]